jgi:hypothetical protein
VCSHRRSRGCRPRTAANEAAKRLTMVCTPMTGGIRAAGCLVCFDLLHVQCMQPHTLIIIKMTAASRFLLLFFTSDCSSLCGRCSDSRNTYQQGVCCKLCSQTIG